MTIEKWKVSDEAHQKLTKSQLNLKESYSLNSVLALDVPASADFNTKGGVESAVFVLGISENDVSIRANSIINALNAMPAWQELNELKLDKMVFLGCKDSSGEMFPRFGMKKELEDTAIYYVDPNNVEIYEEVLCWMNLDVLPKIVDFKKVATQKAEFADAEWNF